MSASTAEELLSSFARVVNSLDSDVNRLSELADIRTELLSNSSSSNPSENCENSNPNASQTGSSTTVATLKDLDETLAELERRADEMEVVVEAEKAASKELEKNRDLALRQKEFLASIMPHLPPKLPGDAMSSSSSSRSNSSHPAPPRSIPVTASTVTDDNSSLADTADTVSLMSAPSVNTLRSAPKIEIVSESELMAVQKSIRSRVTLSALNDAVVDINDVAANKYKALSQASGKGRKTKKFQQLIIHHRETVVPEHEGRFFVSEQDLRDCCAFFRGGESTARAVLNILRSTKRLKQIQGGGGVVTYAFL